MTRSRPHGRAAAAVALAAALLLAFGCSRLTQDNFNRIETGMAFEEVTSMLGEPTDSKSIGIGSLSGTAATWDDGKTRIEIKFVNQKVQLKSLEKSTPSSGG